VLLYPPTRSHTYSPSSARTSEWQSGRLNNMKEGSKIAVGLIGGGTIAPLHAQYLLRSPTCELIAIIDPFPPGQKLARSLSVPQFPTVASLLSSSCKPPDAYIICTPSALHVPIAIDVLNIAHPKVILVENPLSITSSSAAELLHLADQKE
jgi:predicted dehydrogenase